MAEKISNKVDRLIQAMNMGLPQNEWVGIFESILDDLQGVVFNQRWEKPDAATTTGGSAQKDLTGIAVDYAATSVINPDYPRTVNATSIISNGDITSLVLTVTGFDARGNAQTEVITVDDDETVQGAKAFATVTSIAVAVNGLAEFTGGGAGDTLDTGFGVIFGLLADVESDCMIKMNEDLDDSGAADVTISATNNTITFETAPNAVHVYDAWYRGKA